MHGDISLTEKAPCCKGKYQGLSVFTVDDFSPKKANQAKVWDAKPRAYVRMYTVAGYRRRSFFNAKKRKNAGF
jgi:hypothetical protein